MVKYDVRYNDPDFNIDACRRSAKQGYAPAKNNLGCCYFYGKGVPQDYGEATKWRKQRVMMRDEGDAR